MPRTPFSFIAALALTGAVFALDARAQNATAVTPPYLDPERSFAERAADLVARMTLEEKVSQMQNSAPAIPRLGVAEYDWWNEALHGVARAGEATVFPQAIALAATFDTALMHDVATAISDEARAKYNRFQQLGIQRRYTGLTFWSPNINIFRDPRWGRGQETYGEDPYLTSRMGVNFVRGLQGDDAPTSAQGVTTQTASAYRKLDATAKHFAVHSGPESLRHGFDVHPSERDLYETYLPAFQALVREAKVDAVMGAYNRVYGESASASQRLLQDILRRDWGFDGYVVSDCDAVEDIWKHHGIAATAAQAAALAVKHGDNLNCGKTYAALTDAVHEGLISEAEIDATLGKLMFARMRLGMFDPPERVPWSKIPYSVNQSPEHNALARRAARESIVLLKNDGILPLSKQLRRVAVVGPTADDTMVLLGNYYGTPTAPTTILQGIRAALPQADVRYARGADLVEGRNDPAAAPLIEARYLHPAALADAATDPSRRSEIDRRGLRGDYFRTQDCTGEPVLTRIDAQVGFRWDRSSPTDDPVARGELRADRALDADHFCVRWSGQVLPPVSGRYEFSVAANDGARLWLDGRLVIDEWTSAPRLRALSAFVDLKAGKPHDLRLEYFEDERDAEIRLGWRLPGTKPLLQEALDATRNAQAVIFVGGLTGDVEGEEMEVSYPGFAGGDRTDLRLPKTQQKLLEALRATGKPVVVVLTAGSALAVDWAQQNLPAIVLAWYPGQRGGEAVADVLFGDVNPAGRLPVTFYRGDEKLPPFDDYAMRGRTYRYFEGKPLYAFGHGLSYTHFAYSDLHLDRGEAGAGDAVQVSMKLKNTGALAGEEVVQLYLHPLAPVRARAAKELRAFARVSLQPGAERSVSFTLTPQRDLRVHDEQRGDYVVDPGEYEVQIGASSADIRLRGSFTIKP